MTNYVLFLYGMFDDMEDIEYYCQEVLAQNPAVKGLKFIVENTKNLIIVLESDMDQSELTKELHKDLIDQNVKFYFLFRRDQIIAAHIPEQVRNFIFQPVKDAFIQITYSRSPRIESLDLDTLLEKIKNEGIDSLTSDEKKFLDDFDY